MRSVRALGKHQTLLKELPRLVGFSGAPAREPLETQCGHEACRVAHGFRNAYAQVDVALAARAAEHDQRPAPLLVATMDHDAGTFGDGAAGDRFANSGRAAGNQDDFILQSHRCCWGPFRATHFFLPTGTSP